MVSSETSTTRHHCVRRTLKGEFLPTVKIVNSMVDQLGSVASEVTRVAREVGTEGKRGGEAKVKGVAGTWSEEGNWGHGNLLYPEVIRIPLSMGIGITTAQSSRNPPYQTLSLRPRTAFFRSLI